ncbi:MAG: 3-phosphoshikimate 1-carboxyvinyltransferase [Myxococcota bacterium]
MKRYRVRASGPLRGEARVPGDKSIGHRALLFAGLAEGECRIEGLSGGLDNRATAEAMRALGARVELTEDRARIHGTGLTGLRMPPGPVDCGNSGTTMRLLAGLLVAQPFGTRLLGDSSLSRRPMGRIVQPLRARGGHIAGVGGAKPDEVYPPLSIAPLVQGERLLGLEYDMPVASAQVKSALLLSGLYAAGPTALHEPVLSRDHTERMLLALGVPLQSAGTMVVLDPEDWNRRWTGFSWEVPGDFSSAAFLIAAALMVPDSRVTVSRVGVNPTRTGLLDVLRACGARLGTVPKGDAAGHEPLADLEVTHQGLRGARAGGELLVRMIDEVPALCALAACIPGRTEIRDAAELRVKESDRIATMAGVLGAFGVPCEELEDGMMIDGGSALRAAHVRSHGDHRIAMAATLLGMVADGETIVDDVECVETSFPEFPEILRALGGAVDSEAAP